MAHRFATSKRHGRPTGGRSSGGVGGATGGPLHVEGRSLLDANGTGIFTPAAPGKGFNLFPAWAQQDYTDMFTLGARINRVTCRWDTFEPVQGNVPTQVLQDLDNCLIRSAVAGLYSTISLHFLGATGYPSWTSGQADPMTKYQTYGQNITQWFAKRYGRATRPIDLAKSKSVTPSNEQVGFEATKAVDGNDLTTRWASTATGYTQTLTVDLGADVAFNQVRVMWENAYASNYTVGTSTQANGIGGSYTTQATVSGITSAQEIFSTFSQVTARYVKISTSGTGNGSSNLISVWSLNVYNTAGAVTEINTDYQAKVVGLGINEIPVDFNGLGINWITACETCQVQMITWMRAYAPTWVGFVNYGYAAGALVPGPDSNNSSTRSDIVAANPNAYVSVGGNVIIDVHDYVVGDTRTTIPYDSRQAAGYGNMYPWYQGGPGIGVSAEAGYPTAYGANSTLNDRVLRRAQMTAFLKPYKDFSTNNNIPFMVGEFGWRDDAGTGANETNVAADKLTVWAAAGPCIRMIWNYDTTSNTVTNPWSARPGGTWRSSATALMA